MTLYVVRVDNENNLQDSTPCIDCMRVIKELNFKRVVHSEKGGVLRVRNINEFESNHETLSKRILIKRGILTI